MVDIRIEFDVAAAVVIPSSPLSSATDETSPASIQSVKGSPKPSRRRLSTASTGSGTGLADRGVDQSPRDRFPRSLAPRHAGCPARRPHGGSIGMRTRHGRNTVNARRTVRPSYWQLSQWGGQHLRSAAAGRPRAPSADSRPLDRLQIIPGAGSRARRERSSR